MKGRKERNMLFVYIAILIVIILIIIIPKLIKTENYDLYPFKIHFFKVKSPQDSMIISLNGKYIMIDTGTVDLSNDILKYFKDNNITKLDYLILTHFDDDHIGSASSIINSVKIDNILQSNYPKESPEYTSYLEALSDNNVEPKIIIGDYSFTLDELNVVVNGPNVVYEKSQSNNSSLIVSINYKKTNYLFMGDSKKSRIKDFLENNNRGYDFIKIPHHGRHTSGLKDLLDSVKPSYAVITHKKVADKDVIKSLKKRNIKYYLTNRNVNIYSNGEKIIIK